MPYQRFAHDATTTLQSLLVASSADAVDTASLVSAAIFPPAPCYLRIENEILLATSGPSGNSYTVRRGQDGTAAVTHAAGVLVEHVVAAGALASLVQPDDAIQRGVVGAGDMKVTQASSSSVAIAAGVAWVPGWAGVLERVVSLASTTVSGIPVATTGRLDQIWVDTNGVFGRAAGTTDSGAVTLDSRTGFAPLAANQLLIADLLVTSAGVTAVNVRDRRGWARGAYRRIMRNSVNYTTGTSNTTMIDSTNLAPRIECSGVPLRLRLRGAHNGAPSIMRYRFLMDGSDIEGGTNADVALAGGANYLVDHLWEFVPAAGSHVFAPAWGVVTGAGTATLYASAGNPLILTVQELIRQDADNT